MYLQTLHKDANKVVSYMRQLGIDEEIIHRAYLALYVSERWVDNPPKHAKKINSLEYMKGIV
jgi:hypothetical protein